MSDDSRRILSVTDIIPVSLDHGGLNYIRPILTADYNQELRDQTLLIHLRPHQRTITRALLDLDECDQLTLLDHDTNILSHQYSAVALEYVPGDGRKVTLLSLIKQRPLSKKHKFERWSSDPIEAPTPTRSNIIYFDYVFYNLIVTTNIEAWSAAAAMIFPASQVCVIKSMIGVNKINAMWSAATANSINTCVDSRAIVNAPVVIITTVKWAAHLRGAYSRIIYDKTWDSIAENNADGSAPRLLSPMHIVCVERYTMTPLRESRNWPTLLCDSDYLRVSSALPPMIEYKYVPLTPLARLMRSLEDDVNLQQFTDADITIVESAADITTRLDSSSLQRLLSAVADGECQICRVPFEDEYRTVFNCCGLMTCADCAVASALTVVSQRVNCPNCKTRSDLRSMMFVPPMLDLSENRKKHEDNDMRVLDTLQEIIWCIIMDNIKDYLYRTTETGLAGSHLRDAAGTQGMLPKGHVNMIVGVGADRPPPRKTWAIVGQPATLYKELSDDFLAQHEILVVDENSTTVNLVNITDIIVTRYWWNVTRAQRLGRVHGLTLHYIFRPDSGHQ